MTPEQYRQRLREALQRPTPAPTVRIVPEAPDIGLHRANTRAALSRAKRLADGSLAADQRADLVRDAQGLREWLNILEAYGAARGGKGGATLVSEAQRLRDFAAPMLDALEAGELPDADQWILALRWSLDTVERCRAATYRSMPMRRLCADAL